MFKWFKFRPDVVGQRGPANSVHTGSGQAAFFNLGDAVKARGGPTDEREWSVYLKNGIIFDNVFAMEIDDTTAVVSMSYVIWTGPRETVLERRRAHVCHSEVKGVSLRFLELEGVQKEKPESRKIVVLWRLETPAC